MTENEQQNHMAEEIEKMEDEPLLPIEKTLIKWSLIIGIGGIIFLYYLAQFLFPGGH